MSESDRKGTPSEPVISNNGVGYNGTDSDSSISKTKPPADSLGDISRFRISQNYAQRLGVKPPVGVIGVEDKPPRDNFIRCHPTLQFPTKLIELREGENRGEKYLVEPELWHHLDDIEPTFVPRLLVLSITGPGLLFFWAIKTSSSSTLGSEWTESKLDAANKALTQWVRVFPNMKKFQYEIWPADPGAYPEPEWPDLTMDRALDIAFKNRVIKDMDHVVMKQLRGRKQG
jgi:hypothetical protein